ncbi:MAG: nuclease-related domain-containing protein [Halanaerobiaceae bacterium]
MKGQNNMATVIKDKHEKNISQHFLKFRNYFQKQRKLFIKYIITEYIFSAVLLLSLGYYFHKRNYPLFYLNLFLLFIIITVMVIQLRNVEETRKLKTYEDFLKENNEESKSNKGDEGERAFIEEINDNIESDDYIIMNNILLPGNNKYLPQIDSLILGPGNNIYIVEIKNWSGLTIGDIDEETWYSEQNQEYRQNPYLQNKKHIKQVSHLLSEEIKENINIYNLVINMAPNSLFKICKFDKQKYHVYNFPSKLLEWIKTNEENSSKLSDHVKEKIINILYNNHINSLKHKEFKINQELLEKYGVTNSQDFLGNQV